jgi:hypothetical protein
MSDNTLLYPSVQPSQTVPNEKWDNKEYWKANVRWVCSMYNQLTVPPSIQGSPNVDPFYGLQNRFVPQYIKYARYIFGWQYGTNYELTAKDALNNNTQIPLFRGKDIISLFNFYTGKIRDLIKPIPDIMQANCIAGEALSRKTLSLNLMKTLVGARQFLLDEQMLGNIQVETGSDFDLTDEQSIEANFEDFVEGSERTYLKFAKNFYISNEAAQQIIKGSQYCFIGGRISAHVQERNGVIYMDLVPPEYAIIDMSKNDDQHLDDDYAGQIVPYSVSEVVSIWKLNEEEAKDLELIAKNGTSQAPYVSGWVNFNWYQNYNGVPKVWVAKAVQWQSIVYINDVPVSCIREADLIGNKYLKNERIVPNSVLDKRDKRRKRLNYITCSPNTILGTNLGIVGMIHEMQDIRDSMVTNMLSSINRSMGKAVYIDSSQLPEGMRTPEFLGQLKQNGVVAANRAEIDDIQKTNPLIEIIDLTIDPNIITVLNIIQYWDNAIADVLNMPKNVKNGSSNYQSEGQIQTNINTSDTGNQWIYASLIKWVQNILEFAADLQIKEAINGGEDIAVMVGDTMAELLKSDEVQKCLDSDYKLHLNFDNTLDINAKLTLSQMAVQSAGVNPDAQLDYLKIISSKNIKELMNYYQNEKMKRMKIEQEQMAQQQQAALAQTQTMVQGQQQIADQQSQAKLAADQMKIEGKQDEIILKSELENNKEK